MTNYDEVLEKIKSLPVPFQIKGKVKYEQNGISTETILLEYDNSQFVYVEGMKNVTLGWDPDKCDLGKNLTEDLKSYHETMLERFAEENEELAEDYQSQIEEAEKNGDMEGAEKLRREMEESLEMTDEDYFETFDEFLDNWNAILRSCLSPLRKADIGPMIVEVDSRYIQRDMTYEEVLQELGKTPFSIPTEDEWEYLCNGGARTLFRWGDSLKEELNEMFGCGAVNGSGPKILSQPNMLGLNIAYDSYKYELIQDPLYVKGGDGGCSVCGGAGFFYVVPCYTAFYRDIRQNCQTLMSHFHSYRRIIRLSERN